MALTLLAVGGAIYGSLVPLQYEPLALVDAIREFDEIRFLNLGIDRRADWVANLLLFVPISFFLVASVNLDRPSGLLKTCWPACAVLLCTGLSIAIEFAQLWFPPRTVSQNDVLAEGLGSIAGALLWIVIGESFTGWIRSFTAARDFQQKFQWVLGMYTLVFCVYALLPLDVVISWAELEKKVRLGRLDWIGDGFSLFHRTTLATLAGTTVGFVPIGFMFARRATKSIDGQQQRMRGLIHGLLLVVFLELIQVPIFSRYCSIPALLAGMLGVTLGWLLAGTRLGVRRPRLPAWGVGSSLIAAFVYGLFALAVSCFPFDFVNDPAVRAARLGSFWRVPFESLYRGSEFNAVTLVLRNVLLLAPLGVFLGFAISASQARGWRRLLAVCVLILIAVAYSVGLELTQALVASRHSDVTDACINATSVIASMLLTLRILRNRT